MEDLVSVIISSYNRYDKLMVLLHSIQNQTYKNLEIIVVDDGSDDIRYKNKIEGVKILNLENKNSRKVLGFPSCGYVRNFGFKIAKGKYISVVDDDDYCLPQKIKIQIKILKEKNLLACCSEAYLSEEVIKIDNSIKSLSKYNQEYWWKVLSKKLELKNNFPEEIDKNLLNKHNLIICSSVIFNREVFKLIGYMPEVQNHKGTNGVFQDYNYWKKIVKHSNIYFIKEPLLIYYHKYKKNYNKLKK